MQVVLEVHLMNRLAGLPFSYGASPTSFPSWQGACAASDCTLLLLFLFLPHIVATLFTLRVLRQRGEKKEEAAEDFVSFVLRAKRSE